MSRSGTSRSAGAVAFPGVPSIDDGSGAVVGVEVAASEAASAAAIPPASRMALGFEAAAATGATNAHGRRLVYFEAESGPGAAAVTTGFAMAGLRAASFSSGPDVAAMHESLYASAGKRLPFVLHVACRAVTRHALSLQAGHDDYHAVDDTGVFQLFAKDVQEAADLALIAHRIAELSLTPGLCAQDGFLTSHTLESFQRPEPGLVRAFLGDPADRIDSPTPAQRLVFGDTRRRVPEPFDFDRPAQVGVVQDARSYAQGIAAQRPFYLDPIAGLADRAFEEYAALTGRRYARAGAYRLEDAELVLVGQGSVVARAEALADRLRETRGLRVGVLNLTMFRPFPGDLVTRWLRGKRAVTVLERTDQPLAGDLPLLRELRAALGRGVENHRAQSAGRDAAMPHEGLSPCAPDELPELFSGCYGMGGRELHPGDLMAAIENMQPPGRGRRQFYLGLDFVRTGTDRPKLQIWQERVQAAYPGVAELALPRVEAVSPDHDDSVWVRVHARGGWGAGAFGRELATTVGELFGLRVRAWPDPGPERRGQPTRFHAGFSADPLSACDAPERVDVVLCPDADAFRHAEPLAGLRRGGVLVLQSDREGPDPWSRLPAHARRTIREREVELFRLDAREVAGQGGAFLGAFLRVAPLAAAAGLDEEALLAALRTRLEQRRGPLPDEVAADALAAIRHGYRAVAPVDRDALAEERAEPDAPPALPESLAASGWQDGIGHPGRFWEQVGSLYALGDDPIADPFTALGSMPAATSVIRDLTPTRRTVPEFVPENCTGCAKCWTQCPDAAIPGVVSSVEELLRAAIEQAKGPDLPMNRLGQIVKHLDKEAHRILAGLPFHGISEVLSLAWANVIQKLDPSPERRAELDAEWAPVYSALADFPLARTAPYFDLPERRQKGSGGLLSVTVDPTACKGCDVCVAVCADDALRSVPQTDEVVERLRANQALWQRLPETADRFVELPDPGTGGDVLPSLLLKQRNYRSMVGGDGACMGCGEKTDVHLVLSAVNARLIPRVEAHVRDLEQLIADLDARTRARVAEDADLESVARAGQGGADVHLAGEGQAEVERLLELSGRLRDQHDRYVRGPSGRGRARVGFANSSGCSAVWGSSYPLNPYPFPWAHQLYPDAPSLAIGLFEAWMRKMADAFADVRRARLELAGEYDPELHERFFQGFGWEQFSDDELALCPPLFAVGGDGALLDAGLQSLSRLLSSNRPIRVVVLDNQAHSHGGGPACGSGFAGQGSARPGFGAARPGRDGERKEPALLAIAHRGAFVVQSSQAAPSHLLGRVLQGLGSRRPAIFILNTPCPVEWGIPERSAAEAARLALESRAVPHLVYDPDGGPELADCLDLDGNPSPQDDWPAYELVHRSAAGSEETLTLPVTTADWAAQEARFRRHFRPLRDGDASGAGDDEPDGEPTPFHEFLELAPEDRAGRTPFVYTVDAEQRLGRLAVSGEIVALAEERLALWRQLREMAGLRPSSRARTAARASFESELEALRSDYESRLARTPQQVARRLAEGLLRGGADRTLSQILEQAGVLGPEALAAAAVPPASAAPPPEPDASAAGPAAAPAPAPPPAEEAAPEPAAGSAPQEPEEDESGPLSVEPYIDTLLCTSCDDCIKINKRMFAYDDNKQAYIRDPRAGTFRELVMAAEGCPAGVIHPGTPLDPNEKDLDKLVQRAERFN